MKKELGEGLKLILESIADGVIIVDDKSQVVLLNQAAERITGWLAKDALRQHWIAVFNVMERDQKQPLERLLDLPMNQGKAVGLKKNTVLLSKEGDVKYVSASISPIKYEDAITSVIIVFRDITRIIEAEETLRRYQLLSDYANDMIIFSDIDGKIIEANNAALMTFGYKEKEILNKSIFDLVMPNRQALVMTAPPERPDASGVYYEATAKKKDGTAFYVEVSLQSAQARNNRVLLSILRNITERKRVQNELEKARANAEAANHAKSEFLANMSHEIRTPLNGMLGMIDLTLLSSLTDEQRDNLLTAKACASNLLSLISDILDLSRIEAGKLSLENIEFNFKEFVEQTIKPHLLKAQAKYLLLAYQLDPLIPKVVVGDPYRLGQVLNNLLENAIKFTDTGEIKLFAKLKTSSKESMELEFRVSDTGVGLGPGEADRIFDTFNQADNTISRRFGGTGLGLSIAKQLTAMMDGDIWAEGKKGKGSDFYFTVKLAGSNGVYSLEQDLGVMAKTKTPYRILLVEDDRVNQLVMSSLLMEAGHFVEVADNGLEALQIIKDKTFDVVLMDIQMPKMDGIETFRRIRKNEEATGKYLPVVALTAYALQEDKERYLAIGMDGYASKPIQIKDLLGAIEATVSKASSKASANTVASDDNQGNLANIKGIEDAAFKTSQQVDKVVANIKLLEKALATDNLQVIESYAGRIKQLSSLEGMATLRSPAFKLVLAVRREDLTAAAKHFKHLLEEFRELEKKHKNNNGNWRGS